MDLHTLSLCTGGAGIELGFRLEGIPTRTVCYVERETYACEVLASRIAEGALDDAPIWTDLATFDGKPWRDSVDLITAGFPCQPWSVAGQRAGTDDIRWIWPDIARIISEVGPNFVFLENVPGLISGGGLTLVLGSLASMGFDARWGMFSAAEAEAPHKRERWFCLANRHGEGLPQPQGEPGDNGTQFQAAVGVCGTMASQFPPGPLPELWAGVSESLKPTICRRANGLANRVDRLRMIGNGVVPQTVALALRKLTKGL